MKEIILRHKILVSDTFFNNDDNNDDTHIYFIIIDRRSRKENSMLSARMGKPQERTDDVQRKQLGSLFVHSYIICICRHRSTRVYYLSAERRTRCRTR